MEPKKFAATRCHHSPLFPPEKKKKWPPAFRVSYIISLSLSFLSPFIESPPVIDNDHSIRQQYIAPPSSSSSASHTASFVQCPDDETMRERNKSIETKHNTTTKNQPNPSLVRHDVPPPPPPPPSACRFESKNHARVCVCVSVCECVPINHRVSLSFSQNCSERC